MWLKRGCAVFAIAAALGLASVSMTSPVAAAAESGKCGSGVGPKIATDGLGHFAVSFGFTGAKRAIAYSFTELITVKVDGKTLYSTERQSGTLAFRSELTKQVFKNVPPNSNATINVYLFGTYAVANKNVGCAVAGYGTATQSPATTPPTNPVAASLLVRAATAAVPAPSRGAEFFRATHHVILRSGKVQITGSSDGQQPVNVDDVLEVDVIHPDGTTQALTHDFSNGCTTGLIPATVDITSLLIPGDNTVSVVLRDGCGAGVGSTDVYLNADDAILT